MHIKVKVTPGAKVEKIEQLSLDRYIVSVQEEPERGMATARVREVLAEYLKIPLARLRIISGRNRPNKIFEIIA